MKGASGALVGAWGWGVFVLGGEENDDRTGLAEDAADFPDEEEWRVEDEEHDAAGEDEARAELAELFDHLGGGVAVVETDDPLFEGGEEHGEDDEHE